MSQYQNAADALDRLSLFYADIAAANAVLKQMQSLDQAIAEQTAAVTALQDQQTQLGTQLDALNAQIAAAQTQANEDQANAAAALQAAQDQANAAAAQIVAAANASAQQSIDDANAQIAAMNLQAGNNLSAMQAKLDEMTAEMEAATAARDAALATLDDTNAKIAAAQETIKQMLGSTQ